MSEQQDLFGRKGIAYRETSREAWDSFPPVSGDLDRAILGVLQGRAATCEEIELALGRTHQSVSGNLRHLVERGIVVATNRRGLTSRRRKAIVWALRGAEES